MSYEAFARIINTEELGKDKVLIDIEIVTLNYENGVVPLKEVIIEWDDTSKKVVTDSSGFFKDDIILKVNDDFNGKINIQTLENKVSEYIIDVKKNNPIPEGEIKKLELKEDHLTNPSNPNSIDSFGIFNWHINEGEYFQRNQTLFSANLYSREFFKYEAPTDGFLSQKFITGKENDRGWLYAGFRFNLKKGLCFGEYIELIKH